MLFSMLIFIFGFIFFSFLISSIDKLIDNGANYEEMIDSKLDALDMWIKRMEN